MNPIEIIEKKRDGKKLTEDEIHFFINGAAEDTIPDYQAAAFLMAFYMQDMALNNLDSVELAMFTRAMAESGSILDFSDNFEAIYDKHSTGGVGDKISFICAPIMAACGYPTFLLSGRALGHTGGTLDKMEAVPGTNVILDEKIIRNGLEKIGLTICGTTGTIAPADKRFYALRDVTGTLGSVGLISASILSKKMAVRPARLVLDVKFGSGAFMRKRSDAIRLGETMLSLLKGANLPAKAVLSSMNQPLGRMAGNALEIQEALEILSGELKHDPAIEDEVNLSVELAAQAMSLSAAQSLNPDEILSEKRNEARKALENGSALKKFIDFMVFQGAERKALEERKLNIAKNKIAILANKAGYISAIDATAAGICINHLGGGRFQKEDSIDHSVGLEFNVRIGEKVEKGQELVFIYYRDASQSKNSDRGKSIKPSIEEVQRKLEQAFEISEVCPDLTGNFLEELQS